MRIPAWPSDVARIIGADATVTVGRARRAGQATGGSVYCWPARDTCSVQAPPSQ